MNATSSSHASQPLRGCAGHTGSRRVVLSVVLVIVEVFWTMFLAIAYVLATMSLFVYECFSPQMFVGEDDDFYLD